MINLSALLGSSSYTQGRENKSPFGIAKSKAIAVEIHELARMIEDGELFIQKIDFTMAVVADDFTMESLILSWAVVKRPTTELTTPEEKE